MIKLGIHLIVIFHDFAPEIFKRFFSNLIKKLFSSYKYFLLIIFFQKFYFFYINFINILEAIFHEKNRL